MSAIQSCALPQHALLGKYTLNGSYTDCYATDIDRPVSHAEYVEAFYTGAVFKLERLLLAWFISRPSTDTEAKELATGARDAFAAWTVEGRSIDQLLLCDVSGRTRSWLMVEPMNATSTRLYFGSAVVPKTDKTSGQKRMGFPFNALLGFHKLYSRILLGAARSRLARQPER